MGCQQVADDHRHPTAGTLQPTLDAAHVQAQRDHGGNCCALSVIHQPPRLAQNAGQVRRPVQQHGGRQTKCGGDGEAAPRRQAKRAAPSTGHASCRVWGIWWRLMAPQSHRHHSSFGTCRLKAAVDMLCIAHEISDRLRQNVLMHIKNSTKHGQGQFLSEVAS